MSQIIHPLLNPMTSANHDDKVDGLTANCEIFIKGDCFSIVESLLL